MMNMPNSLEIKVKARIKAKKTKQFAQAIIGNSLFQFLLIVLILLPFAYLNLKGWYELLYVIFGLILFLIFLGLHEGEVADGYAGIAIILFIIAGIYYVYVAMPSPFGNYKPHPITNPLINFFMFFSFDFMLASIIYILFFDTDTKTYEDIEKEREEKVDKNMYDTIYLNSFKHKASLKDEKDKYNDEEDSEDEDEDDEDEDDE